jgi:hypothetical protein
MISYTSFQKFYCMLAILLLASQLFGLALCADVDCQQSGTDTNEASWDGCVLSECSTSASATHLTHGSLCGCLCHLLFDPPMTSLYAIPCGAVPFTTEEIRHLFTSPINDIDHPPSA